MTARDDKGRFTSPEAVVAAGGARVVLAGRHPAANTIEALRSAIDNSIRIIDIADADLAALTGVGLRPPASLSRHRSFHLMRLRCYIDRYYGGLNTGIEAAMGKPIDDITLEDLP